MTCSLRNRMFTSNKEEFERKQVKRYRGKKKEELWRRMKYPELNTKGRIPDKILKSSAVGLYSRAIDLGTWRWNPKVFTLARLNNAEKQGLQNGSNGLKQACCEPFKDLFVYAAAKNGFVFIWNIQLMKQKKKKSITKRHLTKTTQQKHKRKLMSC